MVLPILQAQRSKANCPRSLMRNGESEEPDCFGGANPEVSGSLLFRPCSFLFFF